MSANPLLKLDELPAHVREYVTEKPNLEQFGHIEPADFGMNLLKIVHAQNKQAQPGWGPLGNEAPLPLGTMFLSRSGKAVPPGTNFVPLFKATRYIKWVGKPGDGRMDFSTSDPHDPRLKEGLAFRRNPQTGEPVAPEVTTYMNFFIMIPGEQQPVVMSFKRTGINDGRKLFNDLFLATKSGRLPMWTLLFTLNPAKLVRDGALSWYLYSVTPNGHAPKEATDLAKELAPFAKAMNDALTGAELENEEPLPAHTRAAEGAVIDQPTASIPTPPQAQPPVQAQATSQPVQQQQLALAGQTQAAPVKNLW